MASRKVLPFRQEDDFYYERGQDALEQGDFLTANRYYRMVYDRDRQNEEACLYLGESYCCTERYDKAVRVMSVIPANGSFSPEFYFGMGNALCFLERFNEAADMICRYLLLDPDGVYAEDSEAFLEDLKESLSQEQQEETGIQNRIRYLRTLVRCGQTKRAADWVYLHRYTPKDHSYDFPDPEYPDELADAVSDALLSAGGEGAADSARIDAALLRRHPGHLPARMRASFRAFSAGDRAGAEEWLLAGNAPLAYENRVRMANLWLHLSRPDKAAPILAEVLSEHPYSREACFLECIRLLDADRKEEGLSLLRTISQLDPEDAAVRFWLERLEKEWAGLPDSQFLWLPEVPEEQIREINARVRITLDRKDAGRSVAANPERFRNLLPLLNGENYLKLAETVLYGRIEPLYADVRQQLLLERLTDSDKQETLEMMYRNRFLPPYLVSVDGELMRSAVYEG